MSGYVRAEVPVELLFTEKIGEGRKCEIPHYTDTWYEHHLRTADQPIMKLHSHKQLFRYFSGYSEYPTEYLEWYRTIYNTRGLKPPMKDREVIQHRAEHFKLMTSSLEAGGGYFQYEPPIVTYNRNGGYFNLNDGHHRVVFLYLQGRRIIRVKMTREDYTHWIHSDVIPNVSAAFRKHNRKLLYTPILHPAFYHMPSERDGSYPTRLDLMMDGMRDLSLRGKRVLDIGCNTGYFARHFAREGAEVTGLEPMTEHVDLAVQLNVLERVNFNLLPERLERTLNLQTYDIGILLTVFYHVMNDIHIRDVFLSRIDQCISHMLIWESGSHPEHEKTLIMGHTGFKHYVKLAQTSGTGKTRELGYFLKP
ncbi:class I SAM-dependent methyltransferase [Paenibacillus lemnae]|uniref:Methyltransferase domain-containing protein n=1 Tax=Paenibacillus lemnae TaxID=1330551 RepID=A0A848M8N2_PAELE|nr:methyltransferase domain-containing protein [Paenibacillus lemnae]NMO96550.1 methyltransferase domain-containing protein [Paenibacillus lemnae]